MMGQEIFTLKIRNRMDGIGFCYPVYLVGMAKLDASDVSADYNGDAVK